MPELSARYLGKNADRAGVVAMRRIRTSSEKIRAELTWVNQPLDPNKCSWSPYALLRRHQSFRWHLSAIRRNGALDVAHGVFLLGLPRVPVGRSQDV